MNIVNPTHYEKWDEMVLETGKPSIFNSSNWARVLAESYGYEPKYFSIVENGRLAALVPVMDIRSFITGRRGVSLPFSDYCNPIFRDDGYKSAVFDAMKSHGKAVGWNYIEFRSADLFGNEATCFQYYHGHILYLSAGEEQLLSGMRDSTRRNIKKALKLGVKTEFSRSIDALEEFYRLNCMTRKKHGLPPQPVRFFRKIHEHVLAKNLGVVILASHGGRYVAGAVFMHFGDRAVFKYGASDMSYQELRANNLVLWEAIRWYAEQGFKTFCLGRTEQGATGLRQFKNGWGGKEHRIPYFRFDLGRESFAGDCSPVRERYYGIFHVLPVPVLKIAGNILYRHMG